ncbi:LysR family transcriptional regulator [Pokkaliibacter sp. CJK22405]|uniref:LysR family transcriptional regulator n=1 Tax=Pokkaliibacter sp. CJK22405 TaxID=3384615 RepID=UPI0039851496
MLNSQWVHSFSILVEEGSFTRAAEVLDLTQASVSQHIRHLEEQLGPLLIRQPRKLELTPAGQALLGYAREMQAAARRLQVQIDDEEDGPLCGEARIISPGSCGLSLYPRLLDMQAEHPQLIIHHRFAPDPEILDAVLDNRFDLGIITYKPDDARLTALPFCQEELELIVPANARVKGWDDLEALGFIDHPDGRAMATRLLARQFPGNPGFQSLPITGFTNQISLILEPVARGFGFTVMPRLARQAFARQQDIQVITAAHPVVDKQWLIYRSEWPLPRRLQRVISQLSHVVDDQDA